jgi:hypothetical protein
MEKNKGTIEVLSNHQDTQAMFVSVLPSEDGGEIDKPTFLEATCKLQLHHTRPHPEIDLSNREVEGTIEYQYSVLSLMGQATLGQYSQTCQLSLPMSSTCCAIMHGVMICTCFL